MELINTTAAAFVHKICLKEHIFIQSASLKSIENYN